MGTNEVKTPIQEQPKQQKAVKLAKSENGKKVETVEKKKGKHGGARKGAGKKPLLARDLVARIERKIREHGAQITDFTTLEGKVRKVTRIEAVLLMLYEKATVAHDVQAAKEYLDRNLGKSKQPLVGGTSDDDKPLSFDFVGQAALTLKNWLPK